MTRSNDDRSTSQRVVEAVAEERGRAPTELDPLYEVVDPDCLEGIFRSDPSIAGRDANHVEFRYAGCRVIVCSDGTVRVSSGDDGAASSFGGDRANDASRSSGTPD